MNNVYIDERCMAGNYYPVVAFKTGRDTYLAFLPSLHIQSMFVPTGGLEKQVVAAGWGCFDEGDHGQGKGVKLRRNSDSSTYNLPLTRNRRKFIARHYPYTHFI